jgi:hypothetical protein
MRSKIKPNAIGREVKEQANGLLATTLLLHASSLD